MNDKIDHMKNLADQVLAQDDSITFTVLEIGALPLDGGRAEPFHQLLDLFPGSQVIAFEVDKELCEKLNKTARPGMKFYATALGRTEERRPFYETRHSMCSSLYKPNEELISLYNNFEVAYLESVTSIDTVSLDHFTKENDIGPVDFIKIDVQGAEMEIFQGGRDVLKQVVALVSEVEFVPHYIDQPLFGDVCAFLDKEDFMFHKFLGLAGRALAPTVINNDVNFPSQLIWSDAVLIRNILKVPHLPPRQLLKLGVLAYLYGSPDLTFYCINHYDRQRGTNLLSSLTGTA